MKNCELLSATSVNAGVAANLARDLTAIVLKDVEVLKSEHFNKVTVIRERLQSALSAASALEQLCITGKRSNFHEAEQIPMFK